MWFLFCLTSSQQTKPTISTPSVSCYAITNWEKYEVPTNCTQLNPKRVHKVINPLVALGNTSYINLAFQHFCSIPLHYPLSIVMPAVAISFQFMFFLFLSALPLVLNFIKHVGENPLQEYCEYFLSSNSLIHESESSMMNHYFNFFIG